MARLEVGKKTPFCGTRKDRHPERAPAASRARWNARRETNRPNLSSQKGARHMHMSCVTSARRTPRVSRARLCTGCVSSPVLCAAASRAVPRVSTGALPHNYRVLGQPAGAGSCRDRRAVAEAGLVRPRFDWRWSSCVYRLLSCEPRRNPSVGTAYAYLGPRMHRRMGRAVTGMRKPVRGTSDCLAALSRTGLKLDGTTQTSLSIGWTIVQADIRGSGASARTVTKHKEALRCCEGSFN